MKSKGYIQIYTGEGKGKTTAALGLAIRAAGAGLNVYLAQFIKHGEYSEIKGLNRFSDKITVAQFGCGRFIQGRPSAKDIEMAAQGIENIKAILAAGEHQVVILDEANVAVYLELFPEETLLEIITTKPDDVEIIITGRGATQKMIAAADLVTEMQEIKHYFKKGVEARIGIEK